MTALSYNKALGFKKWNLRGSKPHDWDGIQQVVGTKATGQWNNDTIEKLKDWQDEHLLEPDGYFGPLTQWEMGKTNPEVLFKWKKTPEEYKKDKSRPKGPSPKRTLELLDYCKHNDCMVVLDMYNGNPRLTLAQWLWLKKDLKVEACIFKLLEADNRNPQDSGNYDYCKSQAPLAHEAGILVAYYDYQRPGTRGGSLRNDARREKNSFMFMRAQVLKDELPWTLPLIGVDIENGAYHKVKNPKGLVPKHMEKWTAYYVHSLNSEPLEPVLYFYEGYLDELDYLDDHGLEAFGRWVSKFPWVISDDSAPTKTPFVGWQGLSSLCHPSMVDDKNVLRRTDGSAFKREWISKVIAKYAPQACD